ncbi:hypothetical protein Cs7R123_30010 [Catellatospora sp. TT07R-123]|uniref:RDD family protein n=1 Tax=Catellatospora sp. TT07R-123 TaxID=2733863 RepID=UPI001B2CB3D5|nr:RDD family protein [Catellatospora sp. TT07R-123]GHJ45659.1 hypothetical protein Cs7R123_30010 [Catellatospora sp. TT07R-123]
MRYASWFARAAAFLIDVLLFVAVLTIVNLSGVAELSDTAAYGAALAVLAVHGANRWYFGGRSGQSLGRKLVGIRLVWERGERPIGTFPAFLRDLTHAVDTFALYIGWLFPLWDAKRQTFADKISSTVVLKA